MSQTTRCPACQTRFKVVADQLRISDGWVRCGNCKQVFDASLALEPAASEALLPDLPLDELRGPVARATPQAPASSAWGAGSARSAVSAKAPITEPEEEPDDGFAHTEPGVLPAMAESAPVEPLVHPPAPLHVPAARELAISAPARPLAPEISAPVVHQETGRSGDMPWPNADEQGPLAPTPGGYELPAPQEQEIDSDWPALFEESPVEHGGREASTTSDRGDAGELDLAHFIAEIDDMPAPTSGTAAAKPEFEPAPHGALPEGQPESLGHAEHAVFASDVDSSWGLVEDGFESHAPLVADSEAPLSHSPAAGVAEALVDFVDDEKEQAQIELSFVRSARRRAFWTSTAVRIGLALLALVLLVGLLAQVAFRERARLAVAWPQSRSLLETVCVQLHCSVGLHRDIGAVLVEGSAFNRVQGDRYQFSLSLRNRAVLPVEAPAIELTLTDADDQPVLRRILQPADLAVPNPLRPGQEWSTVAPMTLGQGVPRVAGYRVLAFYP